MENKGFMDWEFPDIYEYCKEHNELAWLKSIGSKMVEVKVYPRVKTPKLDNEGYPIYKNGKPVLVSYADKSQEPKIELRRITFVQIKTEFLEHFDLLPKKKDKKPTMYDILDAI